MSRLLQQFNPANYQQIYCWLTSQRNVTTVASASTVSAWATPNGQGALSSFRQTTLAQQPSFSGETYNGYPLIQFNNATTSWLTNDLTTQIQIPCCFMMVAKIPVWPSGTGYMFCSRSSTQSSVRMDTSAGVKRIVGNVGGGTAKVDTTAADIKENVWAIYTFQCTTATTTSYFRVNNNTAQQCNSSAAAAAPNGFNIASRFTGPSLTLTCDVAEVICFSGAISASLWNLTYSYLREKYNIT